MEVERKIKRNIPSISIHSGSNPFIPFNLETITSSIYDLKLPTKSKKKRFAVKVELNFLIFIDSTSNDERKVRELLTNHDIQRYKMDRFGCFKVRNKEKKKRKKRIFLLVSLNKISFPITNLLAF